LPQEAFLASVSCALIAGVGGAVMKRETNVNPNQCQVLLKCMQLSELLFFYMHIIGECDERNALNSELALFHLKRKVATKQFLTEFFDKKSHLDTRILN
jgi:hypothetical protein